MLVCLWLVVVSLWLGGCCCFFVVVACLLCVAWCLLVVRRWWLVGLRCMFIVRCIVFVGLLLVACCSVACYLEFGGWCLLFVVCCLLCIDYRVLCVVCCVAFSR